MIASASSCAQTFALHSSPDHSRRLPNANHCTNLLRAKWITALAPIWSELKAAELYDHEGDDGAWTDPDRFENVNVVASTDKQIVSALSKQMHAAFGFPDN